MLISALCEYADKQEQDDTQKKIPDGWCKQDISYRIMLTPEGDIADIVNAKGENEEVNKKTKVPIILPENRGNTSGTFAFIADHRPKYIFGLNLEDKKFTTEDSKNNAYKSHKAFVEKNLDFFTGLDSEMCTAFRNFIEKWNPEAECSNPSLQKLGKNYKSAYFGFGLHGGRGNLEDDVQLKRKYETVCADKKRAAESSDRTLVTCGILGKKLPIAKTHYKIKKLKGGFSSGCVLVGMKEPAYQSYGKTQSYNSNISELAMKKYTNALNKLLSDKKHRIMIGDMTVVYFAMKADDSKECSFFARFFASAEDKTEENLNKLFHQAVRGTLPDLNAFGVDKDVTFYVVGLTPNSSRICQKFIYRDKFGSLIENLFKHQRDLKINPHHERQIFFSAIGRELISPKATNAEVPPSLMAGIMMAAFTGGNYPVALLETIVRRVKTDSDEEKNPYVKLNDTRAGIIKACIHRKTKKEEITMSLNTENQNAAYLCGRLFAVYEKIQQDASGELNRTIKDSYFASACARPSAIMPKLSQLSQNHMRKLKEGSCIYYNQLIGEIMDKLDGKFPQILDLDAQGRFIIGYYQQNKALYTSKKEAEEI